jgi:hypothetical protein
MSYQMRNGDGKLRASAQIVQSAPNNYDITVGAQTESDKIKATKFGVPDPSTFSETIHIGNPSTTTSFTPIMSIPRASWVSSPCGIKIQMVGPNALFNSSSIVTVNAITGLQSVRAINSSMQIDHSPVGLNQPFNEWSGIDSTITLLKASAAPSGKLTYSMTLTNCQAFLQPPLTAEWTVGQTLPNGNIVATVTATDVTDNQGNNVAHRPQYVVGALVFMHSSKGGMILDTDANVGLTTGEIGVLYAMQDNNGHWWTWSVSGNTLTLTVDDPAYLTTAVYPIVLAPAGDYFGYQTAGSSSIAIGTVTNCWGFYPFTSTSNSGTASSISFYGYWAQSSSNIEMAIYSDGSTGNYLSNSGTNAVALPSTAGWVSANTGSASIAANTTYDLIIQWPSVDNTKAYYNSGSYYDERSNSGQTYGSWSSSISWNRGISNGEFSIYCTYTAGGGGSNPTVVTDYSAPSSITTTGATVTEDCSNIGSANVTSYGTKWGTTSSYGNTITNTNTKTGPFSWSDNITGLSAGTTYHYAAWATNSNGTATGSDATFTTPALNSSSISEASISVSDAVAKVHINVSSKSESAISVSDSVTRVHENVRADSESAISVSDSVTRVPVRSSAISESSISTSDSVTDVHENVRALSESSLSVSDSVSRAAVRSTAINETAISVLDSVTNVHWFVDDISEAALSVSDSVTRIYYGLRNIGESSISVSDMVSSIATYLRSVSESPISVSDLVSQVVQRAKTITESAILVSDSLIYLC